MIAKPKNEKIILILFLIYILGAHFRLSIYTGSGSILVPMYMMIFSAAFLAVLFLKPFLSLSGHSFFVLAFFSFVQPAISLAPDSFSVGNYLGVLQLIISFISCFSVVYALAHVDSGRIKSFVFGVWMVFIALAVLEMSGFKGVFDYVREFLYGGSGRLVYAEEHRDVQIYGKVRSTVFASEPSFLADSLAGLMTLHFLLGRKDILGWVKYLSMFGVSFYLAPSFKMMFYLFAASVWVLWPKNNIQMTILSVFLAFAMASIALFSQPLFQFLDLALGGHMESGSFYGRIAVGPFVARDVLLSYPVFGYGIGNDQGLAEIINSNWQNSGAFYAFPWFQGKEAVDLMTNGFWWQWVFLGVFGGGVFIKIWVSLLEKMGVSAPWRTIICVWIVWYAGFAFVDPMSWYVVAIFAVAGLGAQHPSSMTKGVIR